MRHPRAVLLAVAAIGVVAAVLGWSTPSHLSFKLTDLYSHHSQSFSTLNELETARSEGFQGPPQLIVISRNAKGPAAQRTRVALEGLPQVAEVLPYGVASFDGRSEALFAWLRSDLEEGPAAAEVSDELSRPGIVVGSPALARRELGSQLQGDIGRAELIAFPLLLLLGLWVFRGVVAALLPVLVGGLALFCALGAMRGVSAFFPLSVFSLNSAAALALGLGVDYSLLMVSRFREELAAGRSPRDSTLVTVRTAGRTVAFSAAVIAASFSSLLVFPIPLARSIAVGGILVAVVASVGALVSLPALFTLLGTRVNALSPRAWQRAIAVTSRPRERGPWYRTARFVMRRPVTVAVAASALLIGLGLPALSMRFTGFDVSSLSPSASARVFTEQIRDEFPDPLIGEIGVVLHDDEAAANRMAERLVRMSRRSGLAIPFPVDFPLSPDLWAFNLNPTGPVLSGATQGFVRRLRAIDAPIAVSGETAAYMDTTAALKRNLPLALAILVTASFAFLLWATGSVVLPIKALIMNVLSLGAALGVLVTIFQDGRLQGLLDYHSQHALIVFLPIAVSAGAFGLLTDYGLFLLLRIKEARDDGASDREAIALGFERTGRIITAVALLFSVAVGAFATSAVTFVKASAIGIVVAVILDAFIVRPLLVPSLMAILGKWNWWPRSYGSAVSRPESVTREPS